MSDRSSTRGSAGTSPTLTCLSSEDAQRGMRRWRHHLHRHPETAFAEHDTAG